MIKLKEIDLQEISLEELISYSKSESRPKITILDELTANQFNYAVAYADLLKLVYFIVKGTRKLAFIGNVYIVLKIAKTIKVKAQVMCLHQLTEKTILKSNLKPKQDKELYIVKTYDKDGKRTEPFIDTDITTVKCPILSKLNYRDLKYLVVPRYSRGNKIDEQEVKKLRKEYLLSK